MRDPGIGPIPHCKSFSNLKGYQLAYDAAAQASEKLREVFDEQSLLDIPTDHFYVEPIVGIFTSALEFEWHSCEKVLENWPVVRVYSAFIELANKFSRATYLSSQNRKKWRRVVKLLNQELNAKGKEVEHFCRMMYEKYDTCISTNDLDRVWLSIPRKGQTARTLTRALSHTV
jgi:hypothetical protein